ncbi:MAG: HAMP domain-containing sensor histidine kinase [Ruminococcus sp.]
MKQAIHKRNSIYFQLLQLLLLSAFASVVLFLALYGVGNSMIDSYLSDPDYETKLDQKYVKELQQYITDNQIRSDDFETLYSWVETHKIVYLCVYKNGFKVFDSDYPLNEFTEDNREAEYYEWENYYPVEFADGSAEISIQSIHAYQLYNYVLIISMTISFVLFLILVLLGIRKKMNYILKLNNEIEILEGGSLDYKITVQGKDELAALAEGIDNMRLSFQNLINQEADMIQENQRIVTEMSHDLRTPITSIMLYTEILKKGSYKNPDQLKEYVEKIDRKIRRMKQLTDHLFEYSLITGESEVELEKPELYEVLFYDLLSETCTYLQQEGFQTELQVEWICRKLRISGSYLMRIMDNITSNIVKYADPSLPVVISSCQEGAMTGFVFENTILQTSEAESTGIGIQSIKSMMIKMGGKCVIQKTEEKFRAMLLFPVCIEE